MDIALESELNHLEDTNFCLEKEIWKKFDMTLTKIKVVNFMREYKEAKIRSIQMISNVSICSNYNFGEGHSAHSKHNGFDEISNKKIDAERFVNSTMPIIKELKKTFTEPEQKYYEFCLSENNSEDYLLNILCISRTGLIPIKNSCILKIALAFGLEVEK